MKKPPQSDIEGKFTAGYENSLDGFKKETKRITAANDPKLRKLFNLIQDNPELSRFRNTLKYLMTALYKTDVEVAKQYFDGTLTEEDLETFFKSNQSCYEEITTT